jgi:hypothetical protein
MGLENANAMIEMFEKLPPDRQEALANWFGLQRLIAEHAGLTREEWFALLQEALEHPLDYSFIEAAKPGRSEAVAQEQIEGARQMLGEKTAKTALEGEGIVESSKKGALEQELFQRFQAQKINFDSGRSAKKVRRPAGRTSR